MKVIKPIYHFEVITKIREGKTVCMCDRARFKCEIVSKMQFATVLSIVDGKEEPNRYDFWIEEESEEVNNV